MRTDIISRPEHLSSLKDEWDALAQQQEHPLLSYDWLALTADCYCQDGELRVVVIRSDSAIRAIAPLLLSRKSGIRTLLLLGHAIHFEPGGFLYRDVQDLRCLLEAIVTLNYPIVLDRVRLAQEEVDLLNSRVEPAGKGTWSLSPGSPYISLEQSWEEFEATISSRRRSDLRRARRRAETDGIIHFELVSPDPLTVGASLDQFVQVEAQSWKGRDKTALMYDSQRRLFFQRYSDTAAKLGILRVGLLRIGDRSVAALLAVEYASRFWVLKIGHDEAYARFSPGGMLMHECVRYAFERKLLSFEFLGHDEDWLRVWSRGVHSYWQAHFYPTSLNGLLARTVDRTRSMVRRMGKRSN